MSTLVLDSNASCSGKQVPIDDEKRKAFQQAYEKLGSMGERVLGLCHTYLDSKYTADFPFNVDKPNFPMDGFTFIGAFLQS